MQGRGSAGQLGVRMAATGRRRAIAPVRVGNRFSAGTEVIDAGDRFGRRGSRTTRPSSEKGVRSAAASRGVGIHVSGVGAKPTSEFADGV